MSFADAVEHMASALAHAQRERNEPTIPLAHFDGAQPFSQNYVHAIEGRQDPERGMILTDVTPYDLGAPLRYATLADVTGDGGEWLGYVASSATQLQLYDLRGVRMPFVSPAHCRISVAELTRKGTYLGSSRFCSWHPRERRWLTWGNHPPMADAFAQRMRILIGAQFTARYEWHALIGFPKAPRVSIPCSAIEARELFAARDLPPGAKRRAALRHWVGQHYRRTGPELDQRTNVREHLRGATEFVWESLECSLQTSAFDRERAIAK